jgi:hypothetical protein
MKVGIREITWSDGSKGKYLLVNNGNILSRVKITLKQFNALKKTGMPCDSMKVETTEERLKYVLN